MRLTKKSGYHYYSYGIKEKENKNGLKRQYGKSITKLGQLEDILEKYEFETIEELDKYLFEHIPMILVDGKWKRVDGIKEKLELL